MGSPNLATLSVAMIGATAAYGQTALELEGPIYAITDESIELLDGLVRISPERAAFDADDAGDSGITTWRELAVGTLVEIDAVVAASGTIEAVEIEVSDERLADAEIGGIIEALAPDASRFDIGGIEIGVTRETQLKGGLELEAGLHVEVTVVVTGGRIVARSIELEEDD